MTMTEVRREINQVYQKLFKDDSKISDNTLNKDQSRDFEINLNNPYRLHNEDIRAAALLTSTPIEPIYCRLCK
jgi:hypothetical protein